LVATNNVGTTIGPDQSFMTLTGPPPPSPTVGKTVNIKPVKGLVLFKAPGIKSTLFHGHGYVPLTEPRQVSAASEVDARRGTLDVVAATTKHGKRQTGTFAGAVFAMTQTRSGSSRGLTTVSLVEGAFAGAPSYASCTASTSTPHVTAETAKLSPKVLQTLNAQDNHGKFRTKGRYSAATVRGTVWEVSDRCDGTLTTVRRGVVDVVDDATRKTITLHAGQHYLAPAVVKHGERQP
jgi:hypothetical protein